MILPCEQMSQGILPAGEGSKQILTLHLIEMTHTTTTHMVLANLRATRNYKGVSAPKETGIFVYHILFKK